jgi:2-amino-4-hydroxy-6-hydroxymethyldihydropteridine diphosphokinase
MNKIISNVFIGLGANLFDPVQQLQQAMQALNCLPEIKVVKQSSLYLSAPIGYLDQPDFINAVVQIETSLSPRDLLNALLALELRNGRTREFVNAPRTLDLDLLLYGDIQHHEFGLTVPHPQMHLRAFVLQPLLEIAPDSIIPGIGSVAKMASHCLDQKLERIAYAAR